MKKIFLVLLVCLSVCGYGREFRLPLISFGEPSAGATAFMNPWGGEFHGSCRHVPEQGYMELRFAKSRCTFSLGAFKDMVPKLARISRDADFYLTYRVVSLQGSAHVEFIAQAGYGKPLGLRRSGNWETVRVKPGGWSRTAGSYDFTQLKDIHLGLTGTGVVQLSEIGLVFSGKDVEPLSAATHQPAYPRVAVSSPVSLDGQLAAGEWSDAFRLPSLPMGKDPRNPTEVLVKVGAEGMLFGAICRKADMGELRAEFKKNTPDIWQDESLELYVTDAWGDGHFRKVGINANGAYGTSKSGSQVPLRVAARKFPDRWEVEALLPWAYLDLKRPEIPVLHLNVTRTCYKGQEMTRTGWGTLVWNDKGEFRAFALKPQAKQAVVPQLVHLGHTSYALLIPKASPCTYHVHVVSPDMKRYEFADTVSIPGHKLLPFQVPMTDSGTYDILVLGRLDGTFAQCERYKYTETLASVIRPVNYDEFCVFPRPKKLVLGQGTVALKTFSGYSVAGKGLDYAARYFARQVRDFYGVDLKEKQDGTILFGLDSEPAVQAALVRHGLTEDFKQVRYDGFAISVREDEILVAAKVPAGVTYGAHVLADMVKMSTGEVGEAVLKKVRLVDWPRIENRLFHQSQNAYGHGNKYEVGDFNWILERFPIAFRYNSFTFELSTYYQWQSIPLKVSAVSWTPEDLAQVVDFINANGMPVIPCVQSQGHMEWWLFNTPGQLTELREDGARNVICTRHPKTYPTLFSLFDEYNAMASRNKAYAPKFFYTSLDEIRWQTSKLPASRHCPRCAGVPKNQLFLENIKTLNSYLNSKSQRMIMCADMIVEGHSGLNEFKCAEIVDQIPRNVVLVHWHHWDFPAMKDLAKKGFENWKILTGYYDMQDGEDVVKGYGMAMYTYNWWLTKSRMMSPHGSYTLLPQCLVMDFAWNSIPEGSGIWKRRVHEYGNFLMHQWSRKPMPAAGKGLFCLDLGSVADVPVAGEHGWFGEGKAADLSCLDFSVTSIAGIPVSFARRQGAVQCVRAGEAPKSLQVNRKAATLILLHGAYLPLKYQKPFFSRQNGNDPTFGVPIAEYEVVYEDGKTETIPIRYAWNVCDWQTSSARDHVFARYVGDCRWLWTGKTALEASRKGHDDVVLYQYEWVNPHPEKAIRTLRLKKTSTMAEYGLLAISAREVAKK